MPFKVSKFGIAFFVIFVVLALYVKNNSCSGFGIVNFCGLGTNFFMLPLTLISSQEPFWWENSQYDWIMITGILYGVIAYLLMSFVEGQLRKLDKVKEH